MSLWDLLFNLAVLATFGWAIWKVFVSKLEWVEV